MTKYQQFLDSLDIIQEDLFNEIIENLPEVDINLIRFDIDDSYSVDGVSMQIITYILENWSYVYVEDVDFENKTFELYDCTSLEDLEEIKNTFSNWTIINYDDIVEELKAEIEENKKNMEFENLISTIRYKANVEQLKKFVDSL